MIKSVLTRITTTFRGSIVVSISARHAEDPGSIPGASMPGFVSPQPSPAGIPGLGGYTSAFWKLRFSRKISHLGTV